MIKNGLVGRCLVVDASTRERRQFNDWTPVPPSIADDARTIIEQGGFQGDVSEIGGATANPRVEPRLVLDKPAAKKEIRRLYDFEDAMMDNTEGIFDVLWGRYCEMVNKMNLIFAISQNPLHPVITKQAVDFSSSFVRHSIEHIIDSLKSFGDVDGDRCGKAYNLIKTSGKEGLKRSVLMRKGKFSAKELTGFLQDLFEMNCIRCETSKTKGRTAEVYFA